MSDILFHAAARTQCAITNLHDRATDLRKREEGQTMPEYAIIIAAVGVLLILALLFISGRIRLLFSDTGSSIVKFPSMG